MFSRVSLTTLTNYLRKVRLDRCPGGSKEVPITTGLDQAFRVVVVLLIFIYQLGRGTVNFVRTIVEHQELVVPAGLHRVKGCDAQRGIT